MNIPGDFQLYSIDHRQDRIVIDVALAIGTFILCVASFAYVFYTVVFWYIWLFVSWSYLPLVMAAHLGPGLLLVGLWVVVAKTFAKRRRRISSN